MTESKTRPLVPLLSPFAFLRYVRDVPPQAFLMTSVRAKEVPTNAAHSGLGVRGLRKAAFAGFGGSGFWHHLALWVRNVRMQCSLLANTIAAKGWASCPKKPPHTTQLTLGVPVRYGAQASTAGQGR